MAQVSGSDTAPQINTAPSPVGDQPVAGQVLRHSWMFFGNILLLLVAAVVSKQAPWTFSWADVAYLATALGMMAARTLDVLRFGGLTTDEKPATRYHLVRYLLLLTAYASGLWALAQSVQTG